jgi:lon-related putative ATP-dependent protease
MSLEQTAATESPASSPKMLSPDRLRRAVDNATLPFTSTAELEPIDSFIGQTRAFEAVRFGSSVIKPGFNLFAIGSMGARMERSIETMLRAAATDKPAPSDWVYVHNFAAPHRPVAIRLAAGQAARFRAAIHELIEDLKTALPAAFESESYQKRRGALNEAFQKKQADAFSELRSKAEAAHLVIIRTPLGFGLAPEKNGDVVSPEEFNSWDEEHRRAIEKSIEALQGELEHVVLQFPSWDKARRDAIRNLNRETVTFAIGHLIEEAKQDLAALPQVSAHLDAVHADLVENFGMFITKGEGDAAAAMTINPHELFARYEVNVFISCADPPCGAPIVYELNPTLGNLTGRIEYISVQGALVTNFQLIKPGAIHRANGGVLLLDARNLLMEPFSWTALKRILKRGEIVIEDVNRFLGLTSTATLEPDPIPLDLKLVLFGDRLLYYMLSAADPELSEYFKVLADFEDDFDRSAETEAILARLVASIARSDGLRPLERDAVGLVIEQAARLAGHAGKLTLLVGQLRDLIVEADFRAAAIGHATVSRQDVQQALDEQIRRASRLRDRTHEAILQDIALIDTKGKRIGQINGLSVLELGGFSFGQPTRITCRARPGSGHVVDIEREVKLGGPLHSKGVLILSGFLAGRYALDVPLSLYASIVFEQSYGGVEGDSASSAELYALLSALAETPLRQDIAVTGSVNQHGDIQAIGGVNEKIEGFFDICRAQGLTGTQGVAIPKANVQHLMLRQDVVDACAAGQFAIYAVATIDEGIALLTGTPAGVRTASGPYPPGSVNFMVEERLLGFANILQRHRENGAHDQPAQRDPG